MLTDNHDIVANNSKDIKLFNVHTVVVGQQVNLSLKVDLDDTLVLYGKVT